MADTVNPSFHPGARVYPDGNATILSGRQSGDTFDRFQFTSDGRILAGNGSAALSSPQDFSLRQPTSGFFFPPIETLSGNGCTMSTQQLNLTVFQAEQTMLVSNITVQNGNTAAGATPSLIRVGLYSVSGTTATQLCVCTSDTSKLAAAYTAYTFPMTAPAVVTRGTTYFAAALVVTAAAAPTLLARPAAAVGNATYDSLFGSGYRSGAIAGQADLPATFTTTNIAGPTQTYPVPWFWLT